MSGIASARKQSFQTQPKSRESEKKIETPLTIDENENMKGFRLEMVRHKIFAIRG